MAVEGKLNPAESVRKLKHLLNQGNIWSHNVFLVITDSDIIIKNLSTRVRTCMGGAGYVQLMNIIIHTGGDDGDTTSLCCDV